ncbi:MAG: hypothetical protein ACTTKI_02390 [Tannerella sp.]|uniref:hypothetical protein n=1 Tax=Tannerella sp. TaxID=2382127 RepID=UPI003FA27043
MSKKRKQSKQTEHERRKIEEARRKNLYVKRLFTLLKDLGFGDAIPLFDKKLLELLCFARPALLRMDTSEVKDWEGNYKTFIQTEFYRLMERWKVPFSGQEGDTRMISCADYFELWMPLTLQLSIEVKKPSERASRERILNVFKAHGTVILTDMESEHFSDEYNRFFDRMNGQYRTCLLLQLYQLCNPCIHLLWITRLQLDEYNNRIGHVAWLASRAPQWVWGTDRKGERRKFYRVGFPLGPKDEIYWHSARIPNNPYILMDPDRRYEVYIQEHAVVRMFERLDGVAAQVINTYMNLSFIEWNVDWYKGSLLIAFKLFEQKVGYFFADFTKERKIVIRTFYFITYDHTPEGEMLSSYAGLKALDKKFLCIDRLSTFLASDFDRDSKLATLFREAGCAHLLNREALRRGIDAEAKLTGVSNEFIEKYLSSLDLKT